MEARTTLDTMISLNLSDQYNIQTLQSDLASDALKEKIKDPSIDTVYFEGNLLVALDPTELKKFASFFINTNIRKLYLGYNNLGLLTEEKITAFFGELKNTSIEELYLDHNTLGAIGPEKLKLLLTCLSGTRIRLLNLSSNKLLNIGLDSLIVLRDNIKNTPLQNVDLSNNGFGKYVPQMSLSTTFPNAEFTKTDNVDSLEKFSAADFLNKHLAAGYKIKHIAHGMFNAFSEIKDKFCFLYGRWKDANHPNEMQEHLKAESIIHELQNNLIKNKVKRGNLYSLKDLTLFALRHHKIPWQNAPIPTDLKEDIQNHSYGVDLHDDVAESSSSLKK